MQNFRPSGWKPFPKLPVENPLQTHPWVWLNTGRAGSGHVGAERLAAPPSPVYRAHITWIHLTLALSPSPTLKGQFNPPQASSVSSSWPPSFFHFFISVSLSNTHKPLRPLIRAFLSQCFQQLERIFEEHLYNIWRLVYKEVIGHYSMVLWSINSLSPH